METTTAPVGGSTTMMRARGVRSEKTTLWRGAVLTALAAVLFPRLNAVLHENQAFWQLDTEAAVLIPIVVTVTLVLFALVGRWAWRRENTRNRPAKAGLASGILALVGVVAFFVSAPIVLGGLALTLGLEGTRRAASEGRRRQALAAIVLGTVAGLAGAIIWLVAS
jgi:hypothetical protein